MRARLSDGDDYVAYVRQKIERGLRDLAEGRFISQEEAERRMANWPLPPTVLGCPSSDDDRNDR